MDAIPACFLAGEPQTAPSGERSQVFSPPSARSRATAATPQPTPEVARIAAAADFPVYALSLPPAEYTPIQLRETTVPTRDGSSVSLFALQYRRPQSRDGGLAIVLNSPSQGATPPRDDLDDGLDAVRLHVRLAQTPAAGDPLTDPAAALGALGCPAHEVMSLQVGGQQRAADLVSWPDAADVHLLRIEVGRTEVVIEAGNLPRDELLSLPAKLVELQRSPALVRTLQATFEGAPHRAAPAAQPARATPVQ